MDLFDGLDFNDLLKPKEPEKNTQAPKEEIKHKETKVRKRVTAETLPQEEKKESVAADPTSEVHEKKEHHNKKEKSDEPSEIEIELSKQVKTLTKKVESLEAEITNLIQANTMIVDAQNTDERKNLLDLIAAGKLVKDDKNRSFVLAEQYSELYTITNQPVHKIYCDEITHINVRKYYTDLLEKEVGDRELVKTKYMVYHKGYAVVSMANEVQFNYIVSNGFIKPRDIMYSYVDVTTNESIAIQGNPAEPTLEEALKECNRQKEQFISHNSRAFKVDKDTEDKLESIDQESATTM